MSRIGLTWPRRTRSVWDRPAADTRLLPTTLSYQAMEGPSTYTRHTHLLGPSCVCAPLIVLTPGVHARGTTRHPRVPGGHRAPARLPRRFPRNSPSWRRDGGYARPPPNGRERLGFLPLSGLPRLTARRCPAPGDGREFCAPIPPNGGALPAYGQPATGDSLPPCRLAGLAQAGPPAPAPRSRPFHRLHPPPHHLSRHSCPARPESIPSYSRHCTPLQPESIPSTRHSRPRGNPSPWGAGGSPAPAPLKALRNASHRGNGQMKIFDPVNNQSPGGQKPAFPPLP